MDLLDITTSIEPALLTFPNPEEPTLLATSPEDGGIKLPEVIMFFPNCQNRL